MIRHKTYYFLSTVFFLWFCNVFVINHHSVKDVKRDPQSHENNYFGEIAKLLKGYQNYGENIKLGMWNRPLGSPGGYNKHWARILKMLGLPPGCNAVDIGANDGKGRLPIWAHLKSESSMIRGGSHRGENKFP